MNNYLEKIYYTPSSSGSFGGINRLYNAARIGVSRKEVTDFLSGASAYTLHKPVPKKYKRIKVVAQAPMHHLQLDLCDMQKFATYNDDIKYMLVIIDVYSRYSWVLPLKNKTSILVATAFRNFLVKTGNIPAYIATDEGGEFKGTPFKRLLSDFGIGVCSLHSVHKAMIAERFIRTLKERLYRYFTYTKKHRYIDVLPKIVESYNKSKHTTTGKTPESMINKPIYTLSTIQKHKGTKIKVGDYVRISRTADIFKKGYTEGWTREVYKIYKISPVTGLYHIKDLKDEYIQGGFYENELQKITFRVDEYYDIEKIISSRGQGRGQQYLVKWKGYPASFNSYIKASDIKHSE